MRILVVAASNAGLWSSERSASAARTAALLKAVESASREVRLVMVPAGYWTAASRPAAANVLHNLAAATTTVLANKRLTLIGGIDSLPIPTKKELSPAVSKHALPFGGFRLTASGVGAGPWRQVSTTRANAVTAPQAKIDAIASRVFDVGSNKVLPLVCGEMHSQPIRSLASKIAPDLVAIFGHQKLGQGLTPSIRAMHRVTGAAVVHTQHLVPTTRGRIHWITAGGEMGSEPVATQGENHGITGFWISTHEIDL